MLKTDLTTAIIATIFGVLVSYFVCNLFIGPIEDVTIKTVDPNVSAELVEPNKEIFNYKALNPTVEVYVGNCSEYNSYGECVEIIENEENSEENNDEENNSQNNSDQNDENESTENQNENSEETNTNQDNT